MKTNNQEWDMTRTARITGIWYLLLAITGLLGMMVIHSRIFITSDPAQTLRNLTDQESLARIRVLLELGIITSQALTAYWFYKLFREIDPAGAWAIGIWGMINSGVIMISAIAMGSALGVAGAAHLAVEDKVTIIQVLNQLISNSWGVGGLFFGLWLIPMGYVTIQTKVMPVWLGRILIIGGFGYLFNTIFRYMGITSSWTELLVIPASIGEFWMIGYLLIRGKIMRSVE